MNLISYHQVRLIKHIPHFTTTQLHNITDIVINLPKYWNPRFTLFENKIRTFKKDSDNFRIIRIFPDFKNIILTIYICMVKDGKTRFSIS